MTAITGADTFFTNLDSTFTATKWETCIDQSIDKINAFARTALIGNMTGAAGSKTVTVTSMQAGFIRDLTVAIYANNKNAGSVSSSVGVGGLSISSSAGISQIDELAKSAAICLTTRSFRKT